MARRYPNAVYPPTSPASVEIYQHFPPTPYEVIGEIEYRGSAFASWEQAGDALRKEAARIGGDAVVIERQETPQVGAIPQYAPPPPEQVVVAGGDQYDLYSTSGERIGTARRRGATVIDLTQTGGEPRVVGSTENGAARMPNLGEPQPFDGWSDQASPGSTNEPGLVTSLLTKFEQ